ncbi:hypothetical protein FQA39_LY11452 [Lamprigera yunnana]|nr:hypothetical protein FQA39_LY11452 [Lamprigera yunnana]
MQKIVAILSVISLVAVESSVPPEFAKAFADFIAPFKSECICASDVDPAAVEKWLFESQFPNNACLKCFIKCVSMRTNLLHPDGSANVEELIRVYRGLPAPWDVKCKDYSNRAKMGDHYDMLIGKYREKYPNSEKQEVVKKIISLRINIRQELKRIRDAEKKATVSENKSLDEGEDDGSDSSVDMVLESEEEADWPQVEEDESTLEELNSHYEVNDFILVKLEAAGHNKFVYYVAKVLCKLEDGAEVSFLRKREKIVLMACTSSAFGFFWGSSEESSPRTVQPYPIAAYYHRLVQMPQPQQQGEEERISMPSIPIQVPLQASLSAIPNVQNVQLVPCICPIQQDFDYEKQLENINNIYLAQKHVAK